MLYNNPHTTYTSPKGKEFRVTGIEKIEDSDKWVNGELKYEWIVNIRYIEDNSSAKLHYNHYDKIIKVEK